MELNGISGMGEQNNMTTLNNYIFHKENKNLDLQRAKTVQKKLFLPKLIFLFLPLFLLIMLIYKISIGENAFENNIIFIIFLIYMLIAIPLMIILSLIGSICPYCHKLQSLNSRSAGLEGDSLFIFKGISPFIHYCSRCGAPLSKKAVNEIYNKHNLQ